MIRTTTASAAALLGLGLLTPATTTYAAAADTCQGQPATIVGTDNQRLVGTEGADVIVTNGAQSVEALGGADLVCVTGAVVGPPTTARVVVVDAGAGDDRVEVSTPQWTTRTTLGSGADTFVATNAAEHTVQAGDWTSSGVLRMADTEADVVRVTNGSGAVTTGEDGATNADVVEIASGSVVWRGRQEAPGALTATGNGHLTLFTADTEPKLDARAGTMVAADTSLSFTGFTGFEVAATADEGKFWFRGSHRDERLTLRAAMDLDRYVVMGGGDDHFASNSLGGRDSWVRGSGGHNTLVLSLPGHRVSADMQRKRVSVDRSGKRVTLSAGGFTDWTLAATRADVTGTRRGEQIGVVACRATVRAMAGDDVVLHAEEIDDSWDPPRCRVRHLDANGGRGRDALTGSNGSDRLVGGAGRDTIDGRGGRDTCEGEKLRSCEKRA